MSTMQRISIVFVLLSFSAAFAKSKEAPSSDHLSGAMVTSLQKIAGLYQLYDCTNEFPSETAENLVATCKEAFENPEIMSTKGPVNCYFDLEAFQVTTNSNSLTPEYRISPSGEISKVAKGDLSVAANECRNLENSKHKGRHPASEDLCLSYYPDKKFSEFQEKVECNEMKAKPAEEIKKSDDNEHVSSLSRPLTVADDDDDGTDVGDNDSSVIA